MEAILLRNRDSRHAIDIPSQDCKCTDAFELMSEFEADVNVVDCNDHDPGTNVTHTVYLYTSIFYSSRL